MRFTFSPVQLYTLCCLLCISTAIQAADAGAGVTQLIPVADTYIATYPPGARDVRKKNSEQGGNAGATARLKIKKFENMPLFKFDFSGIPADASINNASIDLKLMNGATLNQVSVSSLHAEWNEGTGTFDDGENYELDHDGACHIGPKGINSSWRSYTDSDFFLCFNGEGGGAMTVVKAQMIDAETCRIPVDPLVLHAAIENGSSLVLSDHTGIFTGAASNIFFHSRESAGKEPRLNISWTTNSDKTAPAFIGAAIAQVGPIAGSIELQLPMAGDDGEDGTAIGYRVWVDDKRVDLQIVPRPQQINRAFIIEGLEAGKEVSVKIQAYDEANNVCDLELSGKSRSTFTGSLADPLKDQNSEGRRLSTATLSAQLIDGMTLINPLDGTLAPKQIRGKGLTSIQRIAAVKGETLGLQCLLNAQEPVTTLSLTATDLVGPNGNIAAAHIEFFNEVYVDMDGNWIADILPPLAPGATFSIPSQDSIPTQTAHAIYIDVWVPQTTATGLYSGSITVHTQDEELTLPLEVQVRDVTLPNELSFTVEMNAYGHSNNIKVFHETYRLCHKNRLSYNVVGYGHSRVNSHTAPVLNSDKDDSLGAEDIKVTDWTNYDAFYGPLFSGDITKGLPREGTPATHWYLPFHDSWPYDLEKCNPQLWEGRVKPRDDAKAFETWQQNLATNDPLFLDHFSTDWLQVNKTVGQQFNDHFKENNWTQTRMQIFNNHKFYFSSGSRSLWVMDEPQVGRDFEALGGIYKLQQEVLGGGAINTSMRADISRPQKMGSFMDGGMNEVVISSLAAIYQTYIRDYITAHDTIFWWYGGGSSADNDPAATIALFTKKWSMGCVGGMPVYTTFAGTNDWDKTDSLRVVRFDEKTGMPVASFRMKAYRRAQQDMELLGLLENTDGFNRWHIADLIKAEVPLKMTTISTRPDDPGYSTFENLDVHNFNVLREKVVATLLENMQSH